MLIYSRYCRFFSSNLVWGRYTFAMNQTDISYYEVNDVHADVKVHLPSGVWVVWSVSGPWMCPLASTQSCPSSLGTLRKLQCPDSKSQLPGGGQAPAFQETSSTFTMVLVSRLWMVCNTTWWRTRVVFQTHGKTQQGHNWPRDLQSEHQVESEYC